MQDNHIPDDWYAVIKSCLTCEMSVIFIFMATTSITIIRYFQCPANKSEEGDVATPTQRTICRHLDIRFTDGHVQEHDAKRGAQRLQQVDPFGCNVLGTNNSYTRT